jgi:seryl-tRNA synthetase
MLDIKHLRSHLDDVAEALTIKGYTLDKAQFEALDAERKHSDIESQSLLAKRKQASKKIGELVQGGLSVDDAKAQVNETLALIDSSLSTLKQQAGDVDEKLQQFS